MEKNKEDNSGDEQITSLSYMLTAARYLVRRFIAPGHPKFDQEVGVMVASLNLLLPEEASGRLENWIHIKTGKLYKAYSTILSDCTNNNDKALMKLYFNPMEPNHMFVREVNEFKEKFRPGFSDL